MFKLSVILYLHYFLLNVYLLRFLINKKNLVKCICPIFITVVKYLKNHLFQVDEKKRKIAANSNSKGGKQTAKRPKIDNDVSIHFYFKI